jgi:hypothetical protein
MPDNTYRPLITGWKLWLICTFLAGEGEGTTYRDPAFPARPQCGSPNVRLLRTGRRRPQRYWCLETNGKSRGTCTVEGSTAIQARRAQRKMLIIVPTIFAAMPTLVLTGHGSWLGSGGS